MAPLALVANLTTKWHLLHYLQIWPPDGTTCISCKFGQQMAQLGLVQIFVIRWCHFHCLQSLPPGCVTCIATLPWIALSTSVGIELISSSASVASVKSAQGLRGSHWRTSGPKNRTPMHIVEKRQANATYYRAPPDLGLGTWLNQLCLFSCRQFEDTFENAQWRKVK